MYITVKKSSGEETSLDVNPADPVSMLSEKMRAHFGVDPAQRVIFIASGRQLDEERSLTDQGVNKHATLFFMTRSGVMTSPTDGDSGAAAEAPSSAPPGPSADSSRSADPKRLPRGDMPTFPPEIGAERAAALYTPISPDCGTVHTIVTRVRNPKGVDRFTVHLQGSTVMDLQEFLVGMKKVNDEYYVACMDEAAVQKDAFDPDSVANAGKVKVLNEREFSVLSAPDAEGEEQELAGVAWTTGTKTRAPKVSVALPSPDGSGDMIVLRNTPPRWDGATNTFRLNFGGRVKKASVKNFQLEAQETVLLTFGKFADDSFVLDFAFPLSVVQAASIAIPAFDIL